MHHPFDRILPAVEEQERKPQGRTRRSVLWVLFGGLAALLGLAGTAQQAQAQAQPRRRYPPGGMPTTLMTGEEGGRWATTYAIGEEGGPITTYALYEEGGPPATTYALGEESSRRVTTLALYEEG